MRHVPALIFVLCVAAGAVPGTAAATMELDMHSTLNLETGYTSILSNDPALPNVKDLTTREGVLTRLSASGVYASIVLGYRINAVQLADHSNLNYVDHQLGMDLDLDGLAQRFTYSGKLDVTAQVSVNPSLPDIGTKSSFTPYDERDPDPAARARNVEDQLLASGDMLVIQEDRSGYAMHFGLRFSDEAGRTGRYHIGADLRDNRYDSTLILDKSILRVSGGYVREFLRSEIGLELGHQRYLRGADPELNESTAGLSFARSAYRFGWKVGAGASYTDRDERVRPIASASSYYRGPRIAFDAGLTSEIGDADVEVIGFNRTRAANIGFRPARPGRYPWSLSGFWTGFLDNDQYTGRVAQRVVWSDAISGGITYTRTETLIRDPALPVDRRSSDTVMLSFVWRFI